MVSEIIIHGQFLQPSGLRYMLQILFLTTEMSHNNLLTWQTTVKFAKLSDCLALLPD